MTSESTKPDNTLTSDVAKEEGRKALGKKRKEEASKREGRMEEPGPRPLLDSTALLEESRQVGKLQKQVLVFL